MHFMLIEEKVKSQNSNKNFAIKTMVYSVRMSKVKALELSELNLPLLFLRQQHKYESDKFV